MKLKTARIMANKIIQGASCPAPTTMGKGPMNMNAPKFAEPSESTAATIRIMMPTKIRKKPMINNKKNFWNMLDCSVAYFGSFSQIIIAVFSISF
jgi:hypothetical protein